MVYMACICQLCKKLLLTILEIAVSDNHKDTSAIFSICKWEMPTLLIGYVHLLTRCAYLKNTDAMLCDQTLQRHVLLSSTAETPSLILQVPILSLNLGIKRTNKYLKGRSINPGNSLTHGPIKTNRVSCAQRRVHPKSCIRNDILIHREKRWTHLRLPLTIIPPRGWKLRLFLQVHKLRMIQFLGSKNRHTCVMLSLVLFTELKVLLKKIRHTHNFLFDRCIAYTDGVLLTRSPRAERTYRSAHHPQCLHTTLGQFVNFKEFMASRGRDQDLGFRKRSSSNPDGHPS